MWPRIVLCCLIGCLHAGAFSQAHAREKSGSTQASTENEWALRGRLVADPHDEVAHKQLCSLFQKRSEYRELVDERKSWLRDNPDHWFELINLTSEAEFMLHDPQYGIDETRHFLDQLKPGDEPYAWANYFLGKQLAARGRYQDALPLLEKSTRADPENEEYFAEFGTALVRSGQTRAGIETLKQAVTLCPSCANYHELLGRAYAYAKDYQDQETEYKAAVTLDNKTAERYLVLARLQIQRGELADAETSISGAIRNDPLALNGYLLRARIYEKRGNVAAATRERATAETLLAAEMKKEKSASRMDTAVPLAVFTYNDPEETSRLLEAARPRLTAFDKRILASVYFDLGRPDEGLKLYEESVSDPKLNNAQSHFLVAEALRRAGLNAKAEEHYRRAYQMDPANVTYRYEMEAIQNSK
jgi:tetratricopeptide (TPR) repeat protein